MGVTPAPPSKKKSFLHRNTLKVYLGINFFIQLFLSSEKSAGTKKFFLVPKVSDVRATALKVNLKQLANLRAGF